MKKIILTLLTFYMLSFQSVKSEEVYVGIDYLHNKIETEGFTNISSNMDDEDSGYSLFAGMPINESLDIEVSYNDFGEASLSGNTGDQFILKGTTYQFINNATISSDAKSIGFAAKPKTEISEGVSLYGKLGINKWETTFNVTSTNITSSEKSDGYDVFYGAGVEANLANLKGRVGYTINDIDGEDISSFNFGVSLNF